MCMIFPPVKAQERKAALNKVPEQIILSEVRRMVQDMQALNKKLEDAVSCILMKNIKFCNLIFKYMHFFGIFFEVFNPFPSLRI